MENQLAEVIVENGITYHLAEDGCYYPQLSLEQETDYVIGKYSIMRGEYMMKCHRHKYLMVLGISICMTWMRNATEKWNWR